MPLLPAEWSPQECVWMTYVAREQIHPRGGWASGAAKAKDNLVALARALRPFVPVRILVNPEDKDEAHRHLGNDFLYYEIPLDDLWARDVCPLFVQDPSGFIECIDPLFNGWGGKQGHARDSRVASTLAALLGRSVEAMGIAFEGGAIDVDGRGTALLVKRTWVNANRNPGIDVRQIEEILRMHLGITKPIWLELETADCDVTDGHIDHYARFIKEGVVVVHDERRTDGVAWAEERQACDAMARQLATETDASGRPLKVIRLPGPDKPHRRGQSAANSYVNFLLTNGAILVPELRPLSADTHACEILSEQWPDRQVVSVAIPEIIAGGGGIHCITMQQPASSN